jgi:hypothetical protein
VRSWSRDGEGSGEGLGDSVWLGGLVGVDVGVGDAVGGDEAAELAAIAGRADPAVRRRPRARPKGTRARTEEAVPRKNTRTG